MAVVITCGIQKGGSAKTTTAGTLSYLLSREHRVLAVDLDSQGNLTELLTQQDIYDFHGQTILEAMKEQDARGYIHRIDDTLHILTAEDLLATFPRWLYSEYGDNRSLVLDKTLEKVKDDYDYILIDTPPALGDQTINALCASDAVVVLFEASRFCYSALERFLETVGHAQRKVNPKLKVAGILRSMIDSRRTDSKAFIELVEEDYPELVFETIISRKAATGRLPINGFFNNSELRQAVEPFHDVVKELINRV
ncbi:cobyrinic acid ac-diamide synthase [Ammoniphilus oxalaticus]|uniref:Cobyrinic acid ac-diamide synthase n=1 Tax=Ammoniphilus oxalaticus TaxID=66863 RepID=A0A419SQA5_9BACL|nr:ParA family protein [Ammoniphilus oxalaticus]RKD26483.1 cobyrinic acid ac-diamide synthase [Ammoniphilus oxalaticus]